MISPTSKESGRTSNLREAALIALLSVALVSFCLFTILAGDEVTPLRMIGLTLGAGGFLGFALATIAHREAFISVNWNADGLIVRHYLVQQVQRATWKDIVAFQVVVDGITFNEASRALKALARGRLVRCELTLRGEDGVIIRLLPTMLAADEMLPLVAAIPQNLKQEGPG